MSRIKVRIEGHYEVEDLPFGKDYVWVPAHALLECDCGEIMDAHHTTCPSCGADRTDVLREISGRHLGEEVLHPWHPDYEAWRTVSRAKRKTCSADVECTPLTLVAPAHSFS